MAPRARNLPPEQMLTGTRSSGGQVRTNVPLGWGSGWPPAFAFEVAFSRAEGGSGVAHVVKCCAGIGARKHRAGAPDETGRAGTEAGLQSGRRRPVEIRASRASRRRAGDLTFLSNPRYRRSSRRRARRPSSWRRIWPSSATRACRRSPCCARPIRISISRRAMAFFHAAAALRAGRSTRRR